MKHSTLTMFRRVMAMTLALLLVVGLTGCFGKDDPDPTDAPTNAATEAPTDAATEAPTDAPTEAPTEPPVKGVMGTVSANNLNVRSNHSTDSTVLSQLPVNLRVEILEQKTINGTNWGRIGDMTLPNGTKASGGWLNLHYVKLDADVELPGTNTDPNAGTSTDDKTTTVDPDEEKLGTITAEQLQIRKGAGTTYDTAGSYKKGDRVKILETKTVSGTTWGRTEKGWISMTYVKLDGSAGSAVDTGTNVKQPGATTPTTGSSSGTGTGTSTGSGIEVSNGKTTILGYVVVDVDGLTLRAGPGTKYKALGAADEGDRYPYYQTNSGWYRTSHGWLSNVDGAYLYIEGTTASDGGIAVVKAQEMHVRQGPGTNFKSLTTLKKGESLAILGRSDGWGYTRLGWINIDHDYVTFTSGFTYTTGAAKVIASSLNIRESADVNSKDIGSLAKDKAVTVLEVSGSWGKIEYETGKYGWINMSYVKMTGVSTGTTTPSTSTKYNVSISDTITNGSVSTSTQSYTQGATVTLHVAPNSGYKLKAITVTDANGGTILVTDNKFTMPGANVTVTAEFTLEATDLYTVSIGTVNGGNTVTVSGSTNKFAANDTVTLDVKPADGWELKSWDVKSGSTSITVSATNTFTMPAGDVTVNATFEKIEYTVTVTADANGTATPDKSKAYVGDTVELTIIPAPGYAVNTISGVTVSSNKFTMPAANVTVTVTFKLATTTYKVTEEKANIRDVASSGSGSNVIATINKDATVEVISIADGWAKIVWNNSNGYAFVSTNRIAKAS